MGCPSAFAIVFWVSVLLTCCTVTTCMPVVDMVVVTTEGFKNKRGTLYGRRHKKHRATLGVFEMGKPGTPLPLDASSRDFSMYNDRIRRRRVID
jgi:hypothetical protein